MTRDDSIRSKTWMTEDGRYLNVAAITASHLLSIEDMLRRELTPGYDERAGRENARDFVAEQERLVDDTVDLDLDAFRSAWLQIIADEFTHRDSERPS
jgi:hypothetical protein